MIKTSPDTAKHAHSCISLSCHKRSSGILGVAMCHSHLSSFHEHTPCITRFLSLWFSCSNAMNHFLNCLISPPAWDPEESKSVPLPGYFFHWWNLNASLSRWHLGSPACSKALALGSFQQSMQGQIQVLTSWMANHDPPAAVPASQPSQPRQLLLA